MIKNEKKLLWVAAVFVILFTVALSACEEETTKPGVLTIKDIPSEYYGTYVDFAASNGQYLILNPLPLPIIEKDTIEISMYYYDGSYYYSYDGNETIGSDSGVDLLNPNLTNKNNWIGLWLRTNSNSDGTVKHIIKFETITYKNGNAELSWADGTVVK